MTHLSPLLLTLSLLALPISDDPAPSAPPPLAPPRQAPVVKEEFGDLFALRGVEGAFWIENLAGDRAYAWRPEIGDDGFLPASTFKILNSLIALEVGAVKDVDEIIEWDGVERGWSEWDKDHSMRSAIRVSAVWFYQEIARRIGDKKMRELVARARYGNQDIDGGIDLFWLEGALRITPRQQIDFLRRLHGDELPFRKEHQHAVKEILIQEQKEGHVLRGKTGWAIRTEPNVGWFVGYVTQPNDDVWFFATYVAIHEQDREQAKARIAITRDALDALKILPLPTSDD